MSSATPRSQSHSRRWPVAAAVTYPFTGARTTGSANRTGVHVWDWVAAETAAAAGPISG